MALSGVLQPLAHDARHQNGGDGNGDHAGDQHLGHDLLVDEGLLLGGGTGGLGNLVGDDDRSGEAEQAGAADGHGHLPAVAEDLADQNGDNGESDGADHDDDQQGDDHAAHHLGG